MSSISTQIITAAVNVTESDVYSVGDIAAAMLHVMSYDEDWTVEFVREVMCAVIDDMDSEQHAEYSAIVIEAARAIMTGAARAEDEHGWVDVDDIEVEFTTAQGTAESDEVSDTHPRCCTSTPRTIETVARVQVLSDMIQNRILRESQNQYHITQYGYSIDLDFMPRIVRLCERAIKINRYGAELVAEIGTR